LDTGAIANSTWYHFYVIRRPDTGVVDVVFSTNASTPTLPTNYTQYRRIGSMKTNGSAQWTSFVQAGDLFELVAPVTDISAVPAAETLRTINTPLGISVVARMGVTVTGPGGSGYNVNHWNPSLGTTPPHSNSGIVAITEGLVGTIAIGAVIDVKTNTSSQIYNYGSGAISAYSLSTLAWVDSRGRNA
jgi:hypothetical protein